MVGISLPQGYLLDGKYRIESIISSGGSSLVYLANTAGQKVIIKEFFARDYMRRQESGTITVVSGQEEFVAAARTGFQREAFFLKRLKEIPGIVQILDELEENSTAYLVLEYIEGNTLRTLLEKRKFSVDEGISLLLPLLDTMKAVHAAGILHLDFNPDNILIGSSGETYLIDFGSACMQGERPLIPQAQKNYSAIELYDGSALTIKSDIYSFCAVLYEVLTRSNPEPAVERLLLDELIRPATLSSDISPVLEETLLRGLSLEADNRITSMEELELMLKKCLRAVQKKRWSGRWKIAAAIIVFSLCGIIGAVTWKSPSWYESEETETFSVLIDYRMDEYERAQAKTELEARLASFSDGNYLLSQEEDYWTVTVPLNAFQDQPIHQTIQERFSDLWDGPPLAVYCEPKIQWREDLHFSEGEWIVCTFTPPEDLNSEVEWEATILSIETSLELLDIPYALGSLYNEPKTLAVQIPSDVYNEAIFKSIGSGGRFALYDPLDEYGDGLFLSDWSVEDIRPCQDGDGRIGLTLRMAGESNLDDLYRLSLETLSHGHQQLALGYYEVFPEEDLFVCELEEPIYDGEITLWLQEGYLSTLPAFLQHMILEESHFIPFDLQNRFLIGDSQQELQNINPASYQYEIYPLPDDPLETAAIKLSNLGMSVMYDTEYDRIIYVFLDFSLEENLPEKSIACVKKVLLMPEILSLNCPVWLEILGPYLSSEGNKGYQICTDVFENERYVQLMLYGSQVEPYKEEIVEQWRQLDLEGAYQKLYDGEFIT